MKKGKPPRRRCPHLRLTVVRQAGSSILLGTRLEEQTQWEVPGEMGSGNSGPGARGELLPADCRWPRCVAGRRTEDRRPGAGGDVRRDMGQQDTPKEKHLLTKASHCGRNFLEK